MKKYYFELILENKNYIKLKTLRSVGATLNSARRDLISELESHEMNDFTSYNNKLQEEFIHINNLSDEQVQAIKLLTMFDNDFSLDDYNLDDFNFYCLLDFSKIEKVLNRKLKNIDNKTQLEIAINELAPGNYHELKIIRHYR